MCNGLNRIVIILLCSQGFILSTLSGQSLEEYKILVNRIYGKDSYLLSGEKYNYPYYNSEGDPFLFPQSRKATLCIKERLFEDQMVKYDIFNQILILEYEDLYGGTGNLILQNEWIKSFSFEGMIFKKMEGPGGDEQFFQVIYEDSISCWYSWKKDHKLNLSSGEKNYFFTDHARNAYLIIDYQFYEYRNRRSFIRKFGKDSQNKIKRYMKQKRIRIREISDREMYDLMKYCNSLSDV